jgi:hypothetical protein
MMSFGSFSFDKVQVVSFFFAVLSFCDEEMFAYSNNMTQCSPTP